MKVSEETSQKIKNMSIICAMLVVMIHVQTPTDFPFFREWITGCIAQIGVPFFFVVSGYLLLNHSTESNWWLNTIKKRFHSLVIPFFCLNIAYFPIKYACHYIGYKYFGADHSNPIMELTIKNFLISISPYPINGGPVVGPLWYVRALIYLVMFSPLFLWILKRSKSAAWMFVALVFAVWAVQRHYFTIGYEFSLRCLFYFSTGCTLRLWGGFIIRHTYAVASVVLGLLLYFANHNLNIPNQDITSLANALSAVFLLVGFWHFTPANRWPVFLTENAFALYVLHTPIIYLTGVVYKALKLTSFATSITGVCIFTIFYIASSCFLGNVIRHKTPKLATLFFGGR